jgi:nucleotide-binding universal stress UspA family protein
MAQKWFRSKQLNEIVMHVNKLLIPTELNELSDVVIDFSIDLAKQIQINEIVLLNLIIPAHVQALTASGEAIDAHGKLAMQLNDSMMTRHKDLLKQQAQRHAIPDINIKTVVKFTTSKSDLNHYMKEFNTGLIVSGSQDNLSFMQLLFGSSTEKMIRKIDYPIIIIKEEPVSHQIREIALAIDISEGEDQPGIDEVIAFARMLNARLQLVNVITNDKHDASVAIDTLQAIARKNNVKNYGINVLENYSLEDALHSFSRRQNPDMIALLNQGKGKLHKLIFGSHTEDVLKEIERPVFISKMK